MILQNFKDNYIIELIFDVIQCTCKLALTKTPDKPHADTVILFDYDGIISIKRYHNFEICLGDYKGLNIKQITKERSEFMIDTGDALVTFEASSTYKI